MASSCPTCGRPLLQRNDRAGEGFVLRGQRLLVLGMDGTVRGKCAHCGNEVDLPLTFTPTPVSVPRVRTS